jgi:hypothetical protein
MQHMFGGFVITFLPELKHLHDAGLAQKCYVANEEITHFSCFWPSLVI